MIKCIWEAFKEVGGEWFCRICLGAFVVSVAFGVFWLIILLGWYSFLLIPIGAFVWNVYIESKNKYRRLKNSLVDQLDRIYQDLHSEYCSLRRDTNWDETAWCSDREVRNRFHQKMDVFETLAKTFKKKYPGLASYDYFKSEELKFNCFKEAVLQMFVEATG